MSSDLLKRFPNSPKDNELITPVFGDCWQHQNDAGIVFDCTEIVCLGTTAAARATDNTMFMFELEAGDFDYINHICYVARMSLWQQLKHRFWMWRMHRKVKRLMRH